MTDWPLVPARGLGRYDDLIFSPLDLPAPPEIDPARFVEWMGTGQDQQQMAPKRAFERVENREYPWLMRTLPGDLSPLRDAFPDVHAYLSVFPFQSIRAIVILAQRGYQAVHTHTDSDALCGMRFYLTRKNAEGLHFFRGRDRYDRFDTYQRTPTGELLRADWDRYFRTEEPVYATLPPGGRVFMLNSARAAHAVASNTCELGERIAVLVQGVYDVERRDALIARSVERYGDHAIWF